VVQDQAVRVQVQVPHQVVQELPTKVTQVLVVKQVFHIAAVVAVVLAQLVLQAQHLAMVVMVLQLQSLVHP
jgi:hypothetical protein